MRNKIKDILNSNFKNYSQSEKQEIIERLALIGLRSLQAETKEPIQVDLINNVSNSIAEKIDETGNLRKELTNIKEQLSKLSNKFEVLSSEKKQNTEPSIKFSSNPQNSQVKPIKHGNSIPPQHPNNSNMQQIKENRQNQFFSSQKLHSLPNSASAKVLNTPQSKEKSYSNSQSRLPPHHKLFENDENSAILAKNMNKKPSSAWRIGDRSNSLNSQNNQANEDDYVNDSSGNILPSNINDSHLTDIQKKRLLKSHEQIAPKVTETKPQTMRYDSVKTNTRHHLDDQHIKDILSEEQIQKQKYQSENAKQNFDSQRQQNNLRKKWDSNQQQLQPQIGKQFENNNESYPNLNDNQLHEYVSLSQPQQFLPTPLQPTLTQIQSFQNLNSASVPQHQQQTPYQNNHNPNFTSPQFKEGRENSINTQFNTTEQKKEGYGQSAQQVNQQQQQQVNKQINSNNNKQQHNIDQSQQKKGNVNNLTNNVQIQQQTPQIQQKYATTKSLQKRQEMNKQKKNQDNKKDQLQNTKKQPNYLKNVTSKIKDEIRLQKETHKGGFNNDVIEFFIKDPPAENKQRMKETQQQAHTIKGYQNERVDTRQQNKQIQDDNQQIIEDDEYNRYYDNQQQNQQHNQVYQGQHMNTYGDGYQNQDASQNYDEENNEQFNIHNNNLRRDEYKSYNQQVNQQYYSNPNQNTNIPPVPYIDESYGDLRNNHTNPLNNQYPISQNQQQYWNNKQPNNYMEEDDYSNFDQRNSYVPNNYEDQTRKNMYSNQNNNNYMINSNENFNHMNMPNQIQQDKSSSNFGEQNSFNNRFNDQSSFYSNNTKMYMDQQNNNVNITSNSQNLLSIANNLLQSPFINQFSNAKQIKKESSIMEQDHIQPQSKKYSQSKPLFPEQQYSDHYNNKHQYANGFDQLNDSYQNSSSIQQSLKDISNKKVPSNHYQNQKNIPENLDQSSMIQDNYEKNSSISSSFTSFKPDNNMKEVLQKDGFFQKIFEGDDQFSHQKFDNTFTSHQQSNNNYGNMMNSKLQTRQMADFSNNSYSNNKLKDDSMVITGNDNNYDNPSKYSQIQQKMDYNSNKNNYQFEDEEEDGAMMDKRLYNFFADQQS